MSPPDPAPSYKTHLNLLFPHSGTLRFTEPSVVGTKQARHERGLSLWQSIFLAEGRDYTW